MLQNIAVGFETAVGRGSLVFQMALTEAVETDMQSFNMLYSILDGRFEIPRTASDRVVKLTQKTFVLFLLRIGEGDDDRNFGTIGLLGRVKFGSTASRTLA